MQGLLSGKRCSGCGGVSDHYRQTNALCEISTNDLLITAYVYEAALHWTKGVELQVTRTPRSFISENRAMDIPRDILVLFGTLLIKQLRLWSQLYLIVVFKQIT